jgi:hypothetical protein
MYLRPTNCNRDCERLRNFTLSAPLSLGDARQLLRDTLPPQAPVNFNVFARLHSDADGSARLVGMPERNDAEFGVLGLSGVIANNWQISSDCPQPRSSALHPVLAGEPVLQSPRSSR